jgi:hypothetical protein
MKPMTCTFFTALLLAGIVVACTGPGSGFAGIGGSGYISTGTVTGFGSVFVNGVEFATDAAVFDVEDSNASQQDLRVGMVVQVRGQINNDGITGTATAIRYGDDLQGPISAISVNSDMTLKTLTLLGTTVMVANADTAFNGVGFGALQLGQVVEVSGFYDHQNRLRASYLELRASSFDASSPVEITGPISDLSGGLFRVRGVQVDARAANLEHLADGLQPAVMVEVKGRYDVASNTITASDVQGEDLRLVDDGRDVSIEGYVTRYVSAADFDLNGQPVNASLASLEPDNLQLGAGIRVEAEGVISNGVLQARELEGRSGAAGVTAYVDAVDVANNRFTVSVLPGQPPVTVQMTTATRTEDDVGSGDHFTLDELMPGNYVDVGGYETDVSTITATRVKRKQPEKIFLQGTITAQLVDSSITVLGVAFPVHAGDSERTEYEDENDMSYASHAAFIAATTLGRTVVKIEDKTPGDGNPVGVADKVEVKLP